MLDSGKIGVPGRNVLGENGWQILLINLMKLLLATVAGAAGDGCMPRPGAIVATFAIVVLASAPSWGQFQEPTKEELQMTVDPKAPGAKAVYLYREDVQDDEKSTRTYYERVKILTEKGKESATVRFSHTP